MASIARSSLLRQTTMITSPAARHPARLSPLAACLSRHSTAPQRLVQSSSPRVAAFHASSRRDILPPGPQVIQGTVNDPAPVPETSPAHGSYHWTFERLIAVGLVPLTVAPFAAGSMNPTLDAVLCATLLIHSHMGFQGIIIDYIPKKRFPFARRFSLWTLNAATLLVGVGLYEFETNDVGLTEAVKRIWTA